jgi:hypothetical protein
MAQSVDHVRPGQSDLMEAALPVHPVKDVPGRAFDRLAELYASSERGERLERTELMIRKAERQLS